MVSTKRELSRMLWFGHPFPPIASGEIFDGGLLGDPFGPHFGKPFLFAGPSEGRFERGCVFDFGWGKNPAPEFEWEYIFDTMDTWVGTDPCQSGENRDRPIGGIPTGLAQRPAFLGGRPHDPANSRKGEVQIP